MNRGRMPTLTRFVLLAAALPGALAARAGEEPSREEVAAEESPDRAAAQEALRPIVLDGMIPAFIGRNREALLAEASGRRPKRVSQFLNDALGFELTEHYRAVGVHDYDWHVFGPDLRDVEWDYLSFDPPETMPKDKGDRFRKVTYPAGMESWFAPGFDAAGAGWRKGLPPFGQLDGKLEPLSASCTAPFCGCGVTPRTLWEKEVLLVRGTFDVPPLEEGRRYRFVVGGSAHVNAGEGYAIYVNGRPLAESGEGVGKRQGGQPRGGHVYDDFRSEFQGGKATVAAASFLRYSNPRGIVPPRGHFTLWMEEMMIPPLE